MLGNECYFSSREHFQKNLGSAGDWRRSKAEGLYIQHTFYRADLWVTDAPCGGSFLAFLWEQPKNPRCCCCWPEHSPHSLANMMWPCALLFFDPVTVSSILVTSQYYFHIEVSSGLLYVCRTYYYQKYKKVRMWA